MTPRPLLVPLALVTAIAGCERRSQDIAAAGAPPAVETPVGPVPGPDVERPAASNPYAQDPIALADGRKLFTRYNCAGCHGDHGGGGMGPSLRDLEWLYGDTDAHVFDSIAEGRGHGMPAWGVKIPRDQVWRLAAYVKSLRTRHEPEPPE